MKEKTILTESGKARLRQIISGIVPNIDTIGIITAENPMGTHFTNAENSVRMDKLKSWEDEGGFRQIKGKYGNIEYPILINNISLETLSAMGKIFEQESFIFGEKIIDGEYVGMNFSYYKQNWRKHFSAAKEINPILKQQQYAETKELFSKVFKFDETNHVYIFTDYFKSILNTEELTPGQKEDKDEIVRILIKYKVRIGDGNFKNIAERKIVTSMSDADDFYSEYKGYKFQIPFFDDSMADKISLNRNISYSEHDISSVTAKKLLEKYNIETNTGNRNTGIGQKYYAERRDKLKTFYRFENELIDILSQRLCENKKWKEQFK